MHSTRRRPRAQVATGTDRSLVVAMFLVSTLLAAATLLSACNSMFPESYFPTERTAPTAARNNDKAGQYARPGESLVRSEGHGDPRINVPN